MHARALVIGAIGACFCGLTLRTVPSCDPLGTADGACVSTAREYTFGLRVYCYNGFDKGECSDWDRQEVNGVEWYFHSGQTCSDRDLEEGSNPWP